MSDEIKKLEERISKLKAKLAAAKKRAAVEERDRVFEAAQRAGLSAADIEQLAGRRAGEGK